MNDLQAQKPVLILGGNGKTGSRVARLLEEKGRSIRLASRSTNPAFDWTDPAGWPGILADVDAVYITYQPDLAVPGAVEAIKVFSGMAVRAGVKRLVLLSGRGEEEAEQAERALQESGADWTIIRASWFAQNFSESFLLDSLQAGHVALPLGDVQEPFIDIEDIAEIAASAFQDDRHIGQLYEVTGPRLTSFPDVIAEIAKTSGGMIQYQQISAEEYAAMLRQHEVPEDYIQLLDYLFTQVLDGRNSSVTDGVERALGRPARDIEAYIRETAATGVWSAKAAD